jgi:23S rRNA pseudouridine1911/1915/1917 synthase
MWEFRAKKADRIDRLLREEAFPGSEWLSRQAWDWLFENGRIEAGARKCLKSGVSIAVGTEIRVSFPSKELGLLKATTPADLLWTDGRIALFSKACGISTVPLFPWDSSALANQVATALERHQLLSAPAFAALSAPPILEGGLVQRLDKDTSGIVCAALDSSTKSLFRQLFSGSGVEKTYLAIVSGSPERLSGRHQVWLQPEGSAKVKALLSPPKSELAASELCVELVKKNGDHALVKIRTSQGARHIVRASMAALGAPLVGDLLYGGLALAPHHQLHALSLSLVDENSYTGFPLVLDAPIPRSFLDSLGALGLE